MNTKTDLHESIILIIPEPGPLIRMMESDKVISEAERRQVIQGLQFLITRTGQSCTGPETGTVARK
jgi:hypothetical protein